MYKIRQTYIYVYILLACLLFSCTTVDSSKIDNSKGGNTVETAIVVSSVKEEYQWVKKNYPDYRFIEQRLIFRNKKPYDVLKFENSSGKTKEFFFDISSFFGKAY